MRVQQSSKCLLRDITIEGPIYTYCSNHPHQNPQLIEVPIGPVFVDETREIKHEAIDTSEIRNEILEILRKTENPPTRRYPSGVPIDEMAIYLAGEFSIKETEKELLRIVDFDPFYENIEDPFQWNRVTAVSYALISLSKIKGDQAFPDIIKFVDKHSKRSWRGKINSFHKTLRE